MYHALALLAVGLAAARGGRPRALDVAGWSFLLGIVLFSGSLYVLTLTGDNALGHGHAVRRTFVPGRLGRLAAGVDQFVATRNGGANRAEARERQIQRLLRCVALGDLRMMIFDAHLDMAWNACEWNRNLLLPVAEIRQFEKHFEKRFPGPKHRFVARAAARRRRHDRRHAVAAAQPHEQGAHLLPVARSRLRGELRTTGLLPGHGRPGTSPRTFGPRNARAARARHGGRIPRRARSASSSAWKGAGRSCRPGHIEEWFAAGLRAWDRPITAPIITATARGATAASRRKGRPCFGKWNASA